MHPRLSGNPDVRVGKTLIFLHGCFWHKCPTCYRQPKSKKKFWIEKVKNNDARHERNAKLLRKDGFKIMVIWEHEIQKNFAKVLRRLIKN